MRVVRSRAESAPFDCPERTSLVPEDKLWSFEPHFKHKILSDILYSPQVVQNCILGGCTPEAQAVREARLDADAPPGEQVKLGGLNKMHRGISGIDRLKSARK